MCRSARKEKHWHDFTFGTVVYISDAVICLILNHVAFSQEQCSIFNAVALSEIIEERNSPEHALRIGFFTAYTDIEKVALQAVFFRVMTQEFEANGMTDFHVCCSSSKIPVSTVIVCFCFFVKRHFVDPLRDQIDIESFLLKMSELLDAYDIVMACQYDDVFTFRAAFKVCSNEIPSERVPFKGNKMDILPIPTEVRYFI